MGGRKTMRIRKRAWARPELENCPFYMDKPEQNKGKWKQTFKKEQPIHMELGCGKGGFISQIAVQNPTINYIAVDLIDAMLGLAKRKIEQNYEQAKKEIDNVILARCDIERILTMMDKTDTVDRIYINFCNPWPRGKHQKKRLTHTKQLTLYQTFLKEGGEIHFKTDDDGLFASSLRYFEEAGYLVYWKTYDLHQENLPDNIKTEHEEMFTQQGIKIKALKAKWKN